MRRKVFKRGLATFLTAAMLLPASPSMVANAAPSDTVTVQVSEGAKAEEDVKEPVSEAAIPLEAENTKNHEEEQSASDEKEASVEETSPSAEESAEDESSKQEEDSDEDKSSQQTVESAKEETSSQTEETAKTDETAGSKTDEPDVNESVNDKDSDSQDNPQEEEDTKKSPVAAIIAGVQELLKKEELAEAYGKGTPADADKLPEEAAEDEVAFNTGTHVWHVVSREDFDQELGDAFFESDGSYTINIPEENPFFPYEVQFTYGGRTSNKWFMSPDDSVTIGGHKFYVSANFDDTENTVVTQMSLKVAGDTVIVYPEEKEFTDGDGAALMSLLPLEERRLDDVDLTSYTPVELTQVSVKYIFGTQPLKDTDKVIWTTEFTDDYRISQSGAKINLSCNTYSGYSSWQMIVGEADQLDMDNIRYIVPIQVQPSENWLIPTVYKQDKDGKRTKLSVSDSRYYDHKYDNQDIDDNRRFYIEVPSDELDHDVSSYISLAINESLFPKGTANNALKVYRGKGVKSENEITDQILAKDMLAKDSGYLLSGSSWITIASYDSKGNITGRLPVEVFLSRTAHNFVELGQMYDSDEQGQPVNTGRRYDGYDRDSRSSKYVYPLKDGYPLDKEYYLTAEYYSDGDMSDSSAVTAAYAGIYSSIKQAKDAGATDIKNALFGEGDSRGYKNDYSKGVYLTVFVGTDDSDEQIIYRYFVKTERWEPTLSDSTWIDFYELRGKNENDETIYIPSYQVDAQEDSYGDYSYRTILTDSETDLTDLAPMFWTPDGINLYTDGKLEVSGESYHDFSKGPVHYTAGSESKKEQQNYWLQVVKKTEGKGKLYINSLKDPAAKTQIKDGVTYSTREVVLDGRYEYLHDILLINTGTEAISALKAELTSDQVMLDPYWTLNGEQDLLGVDSLYNNATHGELQNLAKLRIKPKDGVESGNVEGTLTISSGDKKLMVLTLTGTIGDPCITTEKIPEAVKYVPYGVMIQNNNKYSFNDVDYYLKEGTLPKGIKLYSNGELYGVPAESGTFKFTVCMDNSYGDFKPSEKTFTLVVKENTNTNVYNESDEGYSIKQHLGTEVGTGTRDYVLRNMSDQLFVSNGEYDEFIDLWLNGEKLVEGVDYTKESGSTRMTIKSQTFTSKAKKGLNTIAAEFRVGGDRNKELKRTAQNFRIDDMTSNSTTSSTTSNRRPSSGNTKTSSSSSGTTTSSVSYDSKKGNVHAQNGIITGVGRGYSNWQQDSASWKLIYANGTTAAGHMTTLADGRTVEQVLWEKVNGSWYAFGADGYLKSGWIFDYQLNSWYNVSVDTGMQSGWFMDTQDRHTYYLDSKSGSMATGWKTIDNKWYYFNAVSSEPAWKLDETTGKWYYDIRSNSKPLGAMYKGETTPDGYRVNADGSWDGK